MVRSVAILLVLILCQPAFGQLFRRRSSSSRAITSYVAKDGVIISATCPCEMCDDAKAAAARGEMLFVSGGRRYPIRHVGGTNVLQTTSTVLTALQVTSPTIQFTALPPLLKYSEAYREYQRGRPMLVLVGGPGCLACERMKSVLQQMKRDRAIGNVAVAYVSVTSSVGSTLRRENFVPQLVFYQRGIQARRLSGFQPRAAVSQLIQVTTTTTPAVQPTKKANEAKADSVSIGHKLRSTPANVVEAAVALARVQPGDRVYEPGCGDATFLIAAVEAGADSGVGVEFNKRTAAQAIQSSLEYDQISIVVGDMFDVDYSEADVVFLYHHGPVMKDLAGLFGQQLRRGTRVVSYSHDIPDVCTSRHVVGTDSLYLWVVGEKTRPPSPLFGN